MATTRDPPQRWRPTCASAPEAEPVTSSGKLASSNTVLIDANSARIDLIVQRSRNQLSYDAAVHRFRVPAFETIHVIEVARARHWVPEQVTIVRWIA